MRAQGGEIVVTGADTDEVTIISSITVYAETKDKASTHAQGLAIEPAQNGSRRDLGISADARQANVKISDLSGAIELQAQYSTVSASNLDGITTGDFGFSSIRFQDIGGSVDLQAACSDLGLNLIDDPDGFNFDVEVTYGNLGGNVELQREDGRSVVKATGQTRNGTNPVHIRSRFGNVQMNID